MARTASTSGKQPASSSRAPAGGAQIGISQEDVARVAYELYERRGRAHGQDRHDWLLAEQLLRARRSAREKT